MKSPSLENEETEAPSTSIVSEIESAIQEVETPAEGMQEEAAGK